MSLPRINVIAAMARNRVIGVRNTLPWPLPEDLRHFKALTMGHPIVMGRKTYESIGRPLPGRTTVIVTRDAGYQAEGCTIVHSLDEALAACAGLAEVFFVGGAELYGQILPRADRLYLTEIQADYDGDAHFPAFDPADWRETDRQAQVSAAGLAYHFVTFERCRPT